VQTGIGGEKNIDGYTIKAQFFEQSKRSSLAQPARSSLHTFCPTEEPVPRLRLVYPIVLVLGTPSLFADQVAFKNGDRLSGAILKSNAETLVIKTVVAGEVTVSWQQVQEVQSDRPLHVEFANGKT
jgi:hypothetical protein